MRRVLAIATLALASALLGACEEPNAARAAAAAPGSKSAPVAAQAQAAQVANAGVLETGPAPALEMAPGALCNLEFLDDAPFGSDATPVVAPFKVRGWLGDDAGAVITRAEVVLDGAASGQAAAPIALGIARADVAAAYPRNSGLADSGFEVRLDPSRLPPGDYHMYLRYWVGAAAHVCDNGRRLRVPSH